jgi:general secretion pathway protein D
MPTPNIMFRPLRTLLLATASMALFASGTWAQPTKVRLPKADAAKPPRDAPIIISPEEAGKGPDRRSLRSKGLFQLDFDKVEIDKLVQTISDMTGKLFILPENLRGKITIIGPEHGKVGVTAEEAYAAFLAALDVNGLTIYPSGKYLRVVEKNKARQNNIPTVLDDSFPIALNDQLVTKLFKLRYVEPEQMKGVIAQLVSKDAGDPIPFPPDLLIITDTGLNLARLEKIVERLDLPTSNDEIRVIQVQYATATELAEKLRQVFEEKGGTSSSKRPGQRSSRAGPGPVHSATPGSPPQMTGDEGGGSATVSQIIPDERTNKLIIIANEKAFRRINDLLKQLDTPISGEGQVHVYYLENANAEEMASTLASLTQGLNAGKGARPAGAPGRPAGAPATVADLFSGEVKITADKGTNSLVIIANQSDYRNLVNVIEKLDIARRQVFVEAVIMEVNLNNTLDFGVSLHGGDPLSIKNEHDSPLVVGSEMGKTNSLSGILSLATLGGFLAGLQGPAISTAFPIPAFSIVLHALQNSSDVNVLSTPHILASDNEDAEITVGQNVPFQAGVTAPALNNLTSGLATGNNANANSALAATSLLSGYSGLIAPIQRQNVELKVKIKPQINESDFIRLQIDEQTEEIASQNATLGPTTSKRTAKTTVVAKDQQTVVIGGLIQERTVNSVDKAPILGDIPVLGWLFRSTNKTKIKTNLLLFLTPYIIRDQQDFRRIFERKLKERQEFVEQFYGRQPGYVVPVDYERKAGPLAKMFKTLDTESKKIENGGTGSPGEKLITPTSDQTAPEPGIPVLKLTPAPEATFQTGEGGTPEASEPPAGDPGPSPAVVEPPPAPPDAPVSP